MNPPTISGEHRPLIVTMYLGHVCVNNYILSLHALTRKRELVDRLSHLGMSISYTRVLELSDQMGNSSCQQFYREQVVCPPKMRSNVFTTSAIGNIDHNPSSTTAKGSFHGTAISLLQHPSFTGEGVDRSIAIVGGSREASSKMVGHLPHYYTDVPPVTTNMKNISVPATSVVSLARDNFKKQTEEEYMWLEHARRVIEDNAGTDENISWSAFHASRQPQLARNISHTALLPLFLDSAHTVEYDPALHGCGEERGRTCESWPDTCRHIGPTTVCLGKADSVEVAREVW